MMFVRLHDQLVELPTAKYEAEVDGRIAFSDEVGTVIAWFEKLDVLAFSPDREQLRMDMILENQATEAFGGSGNGHSV